MSDDRYIVVSVSGFAIVPGGRQKTGGGTAPSISYSVLDTVDCYREVGKFYAKPNTVERIRRRQAEQLAAELNQADLEHEASLMTDGRIYTLEDEIDSLQVEIRQAKWRLNTLERAPREGRWCNTTVAWIDAVANQKQRIAVLEQELAGVIADQIAKAEGM